MPVITSANLNLSILNSSLEVNPFSEVLLRLRTVTSPPDSVIVVVFSVLLSSFETVVDAIASEGVVASTVASLVVIFVVFFATLKRVVSSVGTVSISGFTHSLASVSASAFALVRLVFSTKTEGFSGNASAAACFTPTAFCTASPPAAGTVKLGTLEHKLSPPPNANAATPTNVSKENPPAVNSLPNFDVISASKAVCCTLPVVRLDKLVSSACKLTSGRAGKSGIITLMSPTNALTSPSKVVVSAPASNSNPSVTLLINESNLVWIALNSGLAPHKFGTLKSAIIILQQIH